MSALGKFGRFGNQLFQYAFLRICAQQSGGRGGTQGGKGGARVECPPWIGQVLFGHNDPPIAVHLPPVIERDEEEDNLFDIIPEAIPFIETIAGAKSQRIGPEALDHGLSHVDLWGFFQPHTRHLRPHKTYFRTLFEPAEDLKSCLEEAVGRLRSRGKTLIGIHLRRGDFVTFPLAGFTFVVPSRWWVEWLDENWHQLERPVLYLCSDDLRRVTPDFEKYHPVTVKDVEVRLPESMKGIELEFYIDFFVLSQCDVVGISNSTFSFVASLLNDRGTMFLRSDGDVRTKLSTFDPWDSEPLLYVGSGPSKYRKTLRDAVRVTYVTQGIAGLLKCLCLYIPREIALIWAVRLYMAYRVRAYRVGRLWGSIWGTMRSILYKLFLV
jgi:hypothetical protein